MISPPKPALRAARSVIKPLEVETIAIPMPANTCRKLIERPCIREDQDVKHV